MSYSVIKPYINKRGVTTHMAHYAGKKYIGPVSKLGDNPIVLKTPAVWAQLVVPVAVKVEDELVVSDDEEEISDDEEEISDDEEEIVISDDEDEAFDETIYKNYLSTKTYDELMDMYWDMMDDETKTNELKVILKMVS